MANQYVPYHAESAEYAKKLTTCAKNPQEKYLIITKWVSKHITYDYIRAITIPKYGKEIPDVERCWKKQMGICMDIASLTTGMLRSVGVNANLIFGRADGQSHAWVEAVIGNKRYRYDHGRKVKKYISQKVF